MEERELRRFSLDFSECKYLGEIYAQIKSVLELPQWCGENLDALWDAVTGMMYTPAEVTIIPKAGRKELRICWMYTYKGTIMWNKNCNQ